MTLIERMKEQKLNARKEKNTQLGKFLSTLISDCEAIGKKNLRAPTDGECTAMIKSWVKKGNITLNSNDNPTTHWELQILETYLPKQMTDADIADRLCVIGGNADAAGDTLNMGKIMKIFKEKYNNQYDGRQLSVLVKEFLK